MALFPFTVFGEPYRRQSSFFLYGGHRLWLGSRKLNSSVQERAVNGGKKTLPSTASAKSSVVMMMVTMWMASVVRPSSDRNEGDGGGQKHRHDNFLQHFSSFEIRPAHGWGTERMIGFANPYEQWPSRGYDGWWEAFAAHADLAATYSDYVFSPMCRFSSRPKFYACPITSSVAHSLSLLARISWFGPFSVGHSDSVVSIESFDKERSFLLFRSPLVILSITSRRGAGATSPTCRSGQGGFPRMWDVADNVGNQTDHRQPFLVDRGGVACPIIIPFTNLSRAN